MATTQELIDQARLRANQVSTGGEFFVDDTEMLIYLNDAKLRLDSLLTRVRLLEHTVVIQVVTSVALTLPSTFLFTQGVFLRSNDALLPLYHETYPGIAGSGIPSHYSIINGSFTFFPYKELNTGLEVEHHYIAQFPKLALSAGSGVVTSVTYPNSWESFIPISAAIDCLSKEEVQNPSLQQKLNDIEKAIITEADMKTLNETHKIQKRRRIRSDSSYYGALNLRYGD